MIGDAVREGDRYQIFMMDFVGQDEGIEFVLQEALCLNYILKYHSGCSGLFHPSYLQSSGIIWSVRVGMKNNYLSSFKSFSCHPPPLLFLGAHVSLALPLLSPGHLLEAIHSFCAHFSPEDPGHGYSSQSPTQQERKMACMSNNRGLVHSL